jgi:hypothetical protein
MATILRTRTLNPNDTACCVVRSSVGTFLNSADTFAGLDSAALFTKDDAGDAMRRVYRAMVNYVQLSVVHLPDSPYRKFFYVE